jgi:hypothetical protein
MSKAARREHPLCSDPFGAHAESRVYPLAAEAHHIIGVADCPSKAFEFDNVMPLCGDCHDETERRKRLELAKR